MYEALCPIMRQELWRCSLQPADVKKYFHRKESCIWYEILLAWSEANYWFCQSESTVRDEIIWWNSSIKIEGRPIVWKSLIDTGIMEINDIVDEHGKCKQIQGVSWLYIRQIYDAIPEIWKFMLKGNNPSAVDNHIPLFKQLCHYKKGVSRMVYACLIDDHRA